MLKSFKLWNLQNLQIAEELYEKNILRLLSKQIHLYLAWAPWATLQAVEEECSSGARSSRKLRKDKDVLNLPLAKISYIKGLPLTLYLISINKLSVLY